MAVFWSYFRDFVRAQKIEDLSESKKFFVEVFQITSRSVLAREKIGVRCTLSFFQTEHFKQKLVSQRSYSLLLFYCTRSSTPKSTRQGLSLTPAPLASPVLSVDGATPHSIPGDNPKVVTKYDDSDTVVTADLGKVCGHLFPANLL